MRWLHLACAEEHYAAAGCVMVPPPCRHWVQSGRCMYGDACFYAHPADGEFTAAQAAARCVRRPTYSCLALRSARQYMRQVEGAQVPSCDVLQSGFSSDFEAVQAGLRRGGSGASEAAQTRCEVSQQARQPRQIRHRPRLARRPPRRGPAEQRLGSSGHRRWARRSGISAAEPARRQRHHRRPARAVHAVLLETFKGAVSPSARSEIHGAATCDMAMRTVQQNS